MDIAVTVVGGGGINSGIVGLSSVIFVVAFDLESVKCPDGICACL